MDFKRSCQNLEEAREVFFFFVVVLDRVFS